MKNFLIIPIILAHFFGSAQHVNQTCITDQLIYKLRSDKSTAKQLKISEALLQKALTSTNKNANQVYQVPVVIHVMHLGESVGTGNNISNTQIMSGIDQLNEDFRNINGLGIDAKIEFVLAKQDPNGNATTGIVRYDASGIPNYSTSGMAVATTGADELAVKSASIWPNTSYYNIWLVNEIEGNDGGFGTQGFAYLPGASSARDGAVLLNTAWGDQGTVKNWNNLGVTITHEMGHALGLYHTFFIQNDADTTANGCPVNNDCSLEGDLCCDTDPHKVSPSFSCKTDDINPCTGNLYGDIVRNYMDYSDQACQVMFSADQIARMRAALEGPRASLLTSKGLEKPIAACVGVSAPSTCTPTTQADGLSGFYTGIGTYQFHNGYFESGFANEDSGYVDKTDDCAATTFVNPDSTYEMKVQTLGINTNYVKGWIDYNNDGSFNNVNELVYNKVQENDNADSINITIPSTAVQNTFLRVRIMVDLQFTPTDACDNPRYGQAEDYALYIYQPESLTSSQLIKKEDLQVHPNPSDGIFNIQLASNLASSSILKIYNTQGQIVLEKTVNVNDSPQLQISLENMQKGVYFVQISNQSNLFNQRIILK